MGNTLPAGSMSSPAGASTIFLGVETSMTLPCGPVPLFCSFCRWTWVFSHDAGCDAASLGVEGATVRATVGARAVGGLDMVGVEGDASDGCRDLFRRFGGCSTAVPPACDTAGDGSESTFRFMPVWTIGLCCDWGGGGGGDRCF